MQLTNVEGTRHGRMIAAQLLDVAVRVQIVRPFIAQQMAGLLGSPHLHSGSNQKNSVCEVLEHGMTFLCFIIAFVLI